MGPHEYGSLIAPSQGRPGIPVPSGNADYQQGFRDGWTEHENMAVARMAEVLLAAGGQVTVTRRQIETLPTQAMVQRTEEHDGSVTWRLVNL